MHFVISFLSAIEFPSYFLSRRIATAVKKARAEMKRSHLASLFYDLMIRNNRNERAKGVEKTKQTQELIFLNERTCLTEPTGRIKEEINAHNQMKCPTSLA